MSHEVRVFNVLKKYPPKLSIALVLITGILVASALLLTLDVFLISRQFIEEPVQATVSADGVQSAEIDVESYSFHPNHLVVRAHMPVELTLRGSTWFDSHLFVIDAPEAGLEIEREIPPGAIVRVRFTPVAAGEFRFYCSKHHFLFGGHKSRRMEGILKVIENH